VHIVLPRREIIRLKFDSANGLSENGYLALCRSNPEFRCERTANGEVVILATAGGEGSYRSGNVFGQLHDWAVLKGCGTPFPCGVEFLLPDGSALSPDASWVSNESLRRLSMEERRQFLRLSPEFVIEVMSPSDRLKPAKEKMERWIANGVQLGWLIDGDHKTVYVYRKGRNPVTRRGVVELAAEGPVKGFVLQLAAIWRGLR
jgi:Uma2 family endonuclease